MKSIWLLLAVLCVEAAPIKEINSADIGQIKKPAIVIVATQWCRIFKQTAKNIKKLKESPVEFYFIDTEKDKLARKSLNIRARPTILFYDANSTLVHRQIGGLTQEGLLKKIEILKK